MNDMADWEDIVEKVLTAPTSDLKKLAEIAGKEPKAFYRGANFRNARLSQDEIQDWGLKSVTQKESSDIFESINKIVGYMMRQPENEDLRSDAIELADAMVTDARSEEAKAETANKLLMSAIEAYQQVLKNIKRHEDLRIWAELKSKIGEAYAMTYIEDDVKQFASLRAIAISFLMEAADSFAELRDRTGWAKTNHLLAESCHIWALQTGWKEGTKLLRRAVEAYRAALSIYTRADYPLKWAETKKNLANALQAQGSRIAGPTQGADLLAEAVTAYRAALTVFTQADHPVHWATTQQNLAGALQTQGTRTAGPAGADLLAEAVTAYRAALTVFTQADHPVQWAMTQENLAIAHVSIAEHDTTIDPRPSLQTALEHVDASLTIFDPDHMPYNYEKATTLRTEIQTTLESLPKR